MISDGLPHQNTGCGSLQGLVHHPALHGHVRRGQRVRLL